MPCDIVGPHLAANGPTLASHLVPACSGHLSMFVWYVVGAAEWQLPRVLVVRHGPAQKHCTLGSIAMQG
jgi:hypothetical protein